MRPSSHRLLAAAGITLALAAVPVASAAAASTTDPQPTTQVAEAFTPDGTISKVTVPLAAPSRARAAVSATVTALENSGPSSSRFDVVILGDGYTASQMDLLRQHADAQWAALESSDPWSQHKGGYNVWLVNVVSNQSGVDNDPTQGISKDTALDMGFFCSGTERLLCVDTTKAKAYAALAPAADAIIVVGNSTKYGGAGYTGAGLATVAGGNSQANDVVRHELGHSVGGLDDEYATIAGTYPDPEPLAPNLTKDPTGAKWASYVGKATPDGGVIGAFQGGGQYTLGVYRPSQDSMMRSNGKPFNSVSLDVMDKAISAKISGVVTPTPTPTATSTPTPTSTPKPTATPTATSTPTSGGACSAAAYSATGVYVGGDKVSYNGHTYQANWWITGTTPSNAAYGPWTDLGACTGGSTPTPTPTSTPKPTVTSTPTSTPTVTSTPKPTVTSTPTTTSGTAPAWSSTTIYVGGEVVSYQGHTYKAQWWTQGNIPGTEQWGPWALQS